MRNVYKSLTLHVLFVKFKLQTTRSLGLLRISTLFLKFNVVYFYVLGFQVPISIHHHVKTSFYMNFEFLWRCCGKFTCFESFLLSLTTFQSPSDGVLQN
jgi:hypothetical protein